MSDNKYIIGIISVVLLLTAFLWVTLDILSPLFIGILLLFMLYHFKDIAYAKPLILCVSLILFFWILLEIKSILFPFIISFILAYLFNPVTDWMEKLKIPRIAGTLVLLVLTFGTIIVIGIFLLPGLIKELHTLIKKIPEVGANLQHFLMDNLTKIVDTFNIESGDLEKSLSKKLPQSIEKILLSILSGLTSVGSFLGKLLYIILIPVLTFYFLKDLERIKDWFVNIIPVQHKNYIYFYGWRFNRILGGYLRGQLIVCIIVGTLTGVGFAVLNLPFALLIGALTGLLNIIPYIGLYLSLTLALLIGLLTPNIIVSMIKIVAIFLFVQGIEAYIISPKIVGQRVGLHPIAVILSILIFSNLFGFWGLLIGVPSAAVIKFLMDEWKRHQKWKSIREKNASITN
ncbi:MAG: AI-2E family transporter [bacterium]